MNHPPVWTLVLEDCDQTFPVAAVTEAQSLECGALFAKARDGRNLDLRFDRDQAFLLFAFKDQVALRPHFPARRDVTSEIRQRFCPCCGILLCHWDELLSFGMTRSEGFRLCEAILAREELPSAIPVRAVPQPLLPGMESFAGYEAEWRSIEWRPFAPVEDGSPVAEPGAAPAPGT